MRRFALAATVACLIAALAPAGAQPLRHGLVPVHGKGVPSWASTAARVGGVDPAERVTFRIHLPFRDERGARALGSSISDPSSPMFRRFLSPAEFRARFAPERGLIADVVSWLRARGFEVGEMPDNRIAIPARGSASQVQRAFGVTLGRYQVSGRILRAPDGPPHLPAALVRAGAGVSGLDEGHALITPGPDDEALPPPPTLPEEPVTALDTTPPAAVVYGAPCSKHDGEKVNRKLPAFRAVRHPAVACGTTPQQLQATYGLTPLHKKGITGVGETIVMVGSHAIRTLEEDVTEWSRRRRIKPLEPGQLRQFSYPGAFYTPDGYTLPDPAPEIQSTTLAGGFLRPTVWAVQSATLIQTMRAIAPGANYLYAGSTSSMDLPFMTLLAVDRGWGDVIVNGWYTLNEDQTEPDTLLISRMGIQAAATGISLLFAAGDLGDGTHHGNTSPSVAYPAHNPDITAVGSTSLILGRGGKYLGELGWAKSTRTLVNGRTWSAPNPASFRGSGGGVSRIHAQPDYQGGVSDAVALRDDGNFGRTVPDVAVAGDAETGMLIGYTQTFPDGSTRYSERRVSSNTASTALFGALIAVANHSNSTRGNLGFVNPAMYDRWKRKRSAYRDIVPSAKPKGGIRIDYVNGATPAGGTSTLLKMFQDFTSNRPRKGYDTVTGLGAPSPSWIAAIR